MIDKNTKMTKRNFILVFAAFAVLVFGGLNAYAQVKRVEMRIGGYLCGN